MESGMQTETILATRARTGEWAVAGCTHRGQVRSRNEDAFSLSTDAGLVVVSDGVGGLSAGATASRLVTEQVTSHVLSGSTLRAAIEQTHLDVIQHFKGGARAGATAVAAQFQPGNVNICWAGDSRAYLWRDGALSQLTRDHSLMEKLLSIGLITPEEALVHPHKNVIVSAVGVEDPNSEFEVSTVKLVPRPGDLLLLCSDGLHGFMAPDEIANELEQATDEADAVVRLLQKTLRDTPAGDNLTVVCASLPA